MKTQTIMLILLSLFLFGCTIQETPETQESQESLVDSTPKSVETPINIPTDTAQKSDTSQKYIEQIVTVEEITQKEETSKPKQNYEKSPIFTSLNSCEEKNK